MHMYIGSAYITKEEWTRVLQDVNMDLISARDSRYDAVFHLVTCADGASEFYNLTNNEARSEDLALAIEVSKDSDVLPTSCMSLRL